jgi:predicted DsbA family dithiol-disulfide isomerase
MNLNIEIYSDMICPWCFIGKRRLEKAVALLGPEVKVRPYWQAFELNPGMPAEGMDRRGYLEAKFGAWGAREALDRVIEESRKEGIRFAFDKMTRVPNTRDAHRLARFAATEGRQADLVEVLFRAYFEEGQDIGNRDVLAALAERAYLRKRDAQDVLDGRRYLAEVLHEEEKAGQSAITFVPFFIVNGVPTIRGAESPDRMAALLRSALTAPPSPR